MYSSLALLQKGLRSYDNMIFDLKDQAISNRKKIGKLNLKSQCKQLYSEEILNRPDMRNL